MTLSRFDALLSEDEVCRRFSALVGARELRKARQNGEIAFVSGKKGAVFYHPEAVAAYLSRKETVCQNDFGNTGDTGLRAPTARRGSMPTGTTSESETLVADHLARKYSKKPETSSSPSSARRTRTGADRPTA